MRSASSPPTTTKGTTETTQTRDPMNLGPQPTALDLHQDSAQRGETVADFTVAHAALIGSNHAAQSEFMEAVRRSLERVRDVGHTAGSTPRRMRDVMDRPEHSANTRRVGDRRSFVNNLPIPH
jgi:hypothetical protein